MSFKKGGLLRFYHAYSFIPGAHGTDIRTSCDTQLSYSHNSRSIFEIDQFDAFGSFVFSPSQLTGEQTEVECLHKFANVTYSGSLLRNSAGCERASKQTARESTGAQVSNSPTSEHARTSMAAGGGENVRGRRPTISDDEAPLASKAKISARKQEKKRTADSESDADLPFATLYPERFPIGRAKRLPKKPAAKEMDKPKIKEVRKKRKVESFV